LLGPEPEEAVDLALTVGAPDPLVARTPSELRPLRGAHQRHAGVEQRLDVHSIVGRGFARRHPSLLGRRSRMRAMMPDLEMRRPSESRPGPKRTPRGQAEPALVAGSPMPQVPVVVAA